MKVSDFITTAVTVFEPVLLSSGYAIYDDPLDPEGIWFCKKVRFNKEEVHIQIHVQPRTVNDKAYEFAINLLRNQYEIGTHESGFHLNADYCLSTRLASWLWIKDREDFLWESDHWWYFIDKATLELACEDALWSLLLYGVPWLETPETKQPY